MDLVKMREIKHKQGVFMAAMEAAREHYNEAIDLFDAEVKDCEFYYPATCHGENDPECTHKTNEVKWCEAETCPLIK